MASKPARELLISLPLSRFNEYRTNASLFGFTELISRVAADQFLFTPVMVGVFFTSQTFLEGKGIDEAQKRLRDSWWPTLQKNWQLWIPTQGINFALVPVHLRLVTVNVVSLL